MLTLKHWYDLEFLKLYFVSFSLKLNFRKRYKINFGTLFKKFLSCFSIWSRALMALDIYIFAYDTYLQDNESRCARFKKRHTMKDRIWCYCKTKLVKKYRTMKMD